MARLSFSSSLVHGIIFVACVILSTTPTPFECASDFGKKGDVTNTIGKGSKRKSHGTDNDENGF